jgi:hypothetical protein
VDHARRCGRRLYSRSLRMTQWPPTQVANRVQNRYLFFTRGKGDGSGRSDRKQKMLAGRQIELNAKWPIGQFCCGGSVTSDRSRDRYRLKGQSFHGGGWRASASRTAQATGRRWNLLSRAAISPLSGKYLDAFFSPACTLCLPTCSSLDNASPFPLPAQQAAMATRPHRSLKADRSSPQTTHGLALQGTLPPPITSNESLLSLSSLPFLT